MLDEWIEAQTLRQEESGQPDGAAPSGDHPPDFIPRFLTTTGELKPLTDDVIAEMDALLLAHARGESPADYEPKVEMPGGHLEPLTREAFDELVAYVQGQSWRRRADRSAPPAEPPAWKTLVGLVLPAEQRDLPSPPDFMPWFDTVDGDLPPVHVDPDGPPAEAEAASEAAAGLEAPSPPPSASELWGGDARPPEAELGGAAPADEKTGPGLERVVLRRRPPTRPVRIDQSDDVVDADWVIEVGQGLRVRRPWDPGPLTSQLLKAIRERRWGWRQVLVLLGVIAVAALVIFVPSRLIQPPEGRGTAQPPAGEAAVTPAGASAATATPALTSTPPPTLAPYQQGRIAFAANPEGNFDIYVLDPASGQVTRLTELPSSDRAPVWSPDGSQIVFVSDRAGDDDLFVMAADGSGVIQLTTDPGLDHTPAWSPDGQRVIFSRETVTGADLLYFDVACMTEPGACEEAIQPLTGERYDLYPDWSPDGARLAFAAADFPGLPSALALLETGTDGYRALEGTGSSDFDPAWSPDGAWLAFVSYNYGDYDLWLISAGDDSLAQITQDTASDVQPVWSPDGSMIAFASDRDAEGDFELYAIRVACALGNEAGTPVQPGSVDETEGEEGLSLSPCEQSVVRLTDNDYDDLDPTWVR